MCIGIIETTKILTCIFFFKKGYF